MLVEQAITADSMVKFAPPGNFTQKDFYDSIKHANICSSRLQQKHSLRRRPSLSTGDFGRHAVVED